MDRLFEKAPEEESTKLRSEPELVARGHGSISEEPHYFARAKGMSQLARDTGLGRESLYKALSGEGNPCFATILKVTTALGIRLHAQLADPP